ncbi:hypothetical protein RND71_040864 [Anisodus tanguticus]|uniref:Uncharacterized protein n=1 Tax=Anisodus tanguticus TaxID=243964 RepID=A0AAE1QWB9_9SOLA|nr:hypothetical protein RND71_040864 [Anisodus tanguticus]
MISGQKELSSNHFNAHKTSCNLTNLISNNHHIHKPRAQKQSSSIFALPFT